MRFLFGFGKGLFWTAVALCKVAFWTIVALSYMGQGSEATFSFRYSGDDDDDDAFSSGGSSSSDAVGISAIGRVETITTSSSGERVGLGSRSSIL